MMDPSWKYVGAEKVSGSKRLSLVGSSESPKSSRKSSAGHWKHHLFVLQQNAPSPIPVLCPMEVPGRPSYYGPEFHGCISREAADEQLTSEGSFLVRESQRAPGSYTLCMRFNGRMLNYKLFFDGQHYVGEKRFDSMEELVADGLICMFMDLHAADYIRKMTDEAVYEESPYSLYQKLAAAHRDAVDSPRHRNESESSSRSVTMEAAQKAHRFKTHTFRIPHYCDYCCNFMWGLVQQGLRCEDCGFAAHRKCSEKTLQDCRPDLRYVRRMFAVDLTTVCLAHGLRIPPVLEHCIYDIQRRGLDVEGIYRISGSHDDIEKLRLSYDTLGAKMDGAKLSRVEDVHTVAGLLKLYLRLLPQPLITFSVYRNLVQELRGCRSDYDKIKCIRRILDSQLPPAHLCTLRLLLEHLWTVAQHSPLNKMSPDNLARIFAPTLLCAASPPSAPLPLPQHEQFLLQFLIVNQPRIFSS